MARKGSSKVDLVCRLCLEAKPNMRAHIMAEGLMKLIHGQEKYDGRFIMVGTDLKRPVRRPTGSYDPNILCRDCDSKLGSLDAVAVDFCRRNDFKQHPSGAAYTLSRIDQGKLKLFCMSYVWRASITTLPEYSGVSLGTKHEEQIRGMLLESDHGEIDDYAVILTRFSLPKEKEKWGMHVLNPVGNRYQGLNVVDVYLPNLYKLKVKVDNRPFDNSLSQLSLGAQEDVIVMDMGDYTRSQEFSIMHEAILKDRTAQA